MGRGGCVGCIEGVESDSGVTAAGGGGAPIKTDRGVFSKRGIAGITGERFDLFHGDVGAYEVWASRGDSCGEKSTEQHRCAACGTKLHARSPRQPGLNAFLHW